MLSKENYYVLLEYYISSAEYWEREWFADIAGGGLINTPCSLDTRFRMCSIVMNMILKACHHLSEFRSTYWRAWFFDEEYEAFSTRLWDAYDFISPLVDVLRKEYEERKAAKHG